MENTENTPPAPEVAPAPIPQPAPSEDTRNRLGAARHYAEEQLDAARHYAEEQYDRLRRATATQVENVRGYTEEARRQINEGWDVTCAKAKDLHQAGEEYVRANPSGSMLGALGLGIILGLLIGGHRH